MTFFIRNVPKAHIAPKATSLLPTGKTSHHRFFKVSLPGDCHASLAMTEYFVRNITRVCLPETICKIFVLSLFYPVQRTLCHCEALPTAMPWQSPGRDTLLNPTQDTFVLAWRKGINKQKTNNCRLRRLFGQKCSLFRTAPLLFFGKVYERLAFSFCNVHRLRRATEIVVDKKHDKIRFFYNVFVAF